MVTYNIEPQISGDTWYGIASITFQRNGSAMDLTDALLEMQVRASLDSPVVLDLSTKNGSILINQPLSSGVVSIPAQIIDIPIGNYIYDLKLTLPTGEVKTYLNGSWSILSHVTR
jgi:hypothetical protein